MLRVARAATLALLATASPAVCGPDDAMQFLMNDRATMHDIGLLQLRLFLVREDLGWSYFDWDANRIMITYTVFIEDAESDLESAELGCSEWVSKVRLKANISPKGIPYGSSSGFAQMFSHLGYENTSAPKDLMTQVDKTFSLNCLGFAKGSPGSVSVEAPLLGTGYSVKKD